ncbi:sensor histidine kinase [Psychroflexus aestuariivivens]|uniref:sensor histidine kinase n=1 Tax=Psychroflexus aestuariivivens TaxID=1795040 RepID=UPI000FD8B655|nr:ATP-binding protein [Psychroflexus aestuariivivens]
MYSNNFKWNLISTKIKLEILIILQEAISNTVKYAKATTLVLDLALENSYFQMLFIDNGVGFKNSKRRKGIGLKNMQKRANQINADFQVTTEINHGTEISLRVHLPHVEKQLF